MRIIALGLLMAGLCAGDVALTMPAPIRIDLYLDGVRLAHQLTVAAGRSRVALTAEAGELVQIDGADTWVVETRIDSGAVPPMPATMVELATVWAGLERSESVLVGQEDAAERMSGEIARRLGERGVLAPDETSDWQGSLEGMLAMRHGVAQQRLVLAAAWRDLRDRAAVEALPGITYAVALGLDTRAGATESGDPETNARRAWGLAVERSQLTRTLVIERATAGAVTVVTDRADVRWEPRSRLLAGKGAAILVRQASVQVPAGLNLPSLPAKLIRGTRNQPLAGAALVPRVIAASAAPVAERRSVTTTTRAAGWSGDEAVTAAREQTWSVPALALAAPPEHRAEVMVELQKGPVELTADAWVLVPDLAPVLMRRIDLRLDAQPLAGGLLELVVDGTVLGQRKLAAAAPGAVIHLAAGEDQRVFLAETTRWAEDPNRPVNRKREGNDYRLRNLSAEAVSFTCYLTHPISAAKGVTITTDPESTAGSNAEKPGILRWDLTIPPGSELILRHGWVIEAEGKIRL